MPGTADDYQMRVLFFFLSKSWATLSYWTLFKPGVLSLFKHVAHLINKLKVRGPPTVQLLQCDKFLYMHRAETKHLKATYTFNNKTCSVINASAETAC